MDHDKLKERVANLPNTTFDTLIGFFEEEAYVVTKSLLGISDFNEFLTKKGEVLVYQDLVNAFKSMKREKMQKSS